MDEPAKKMEPDKAIGHKLPDESFTLTQKDAIMFNMSVNVKMSNPADLKYVYRTEDDPPVPVLPGCGIFMSMKNATPVIAGEFSDTGLHSQPHKVLHSSHYMECYSPIPVDQELKMTSHIADVLDKGKHAVVLINVNTFDPRGVKLRFDQIELFLLDCGGYGGHRRSTHEHPTAAPPDRPPDIIVEETLQDNVDILLSIISKTQNPIHIDPEFSKKQGFDGPIVSGAIIHGVVLKQAMQKYCDGDISRIKAYKARSSSPVYGGSTLCTEMWKEQNRIYLQCRVKDSKLACLTGGYMDIRPGDTDNISISKL